jgi:3-isopropylmalate/(R)-2-methylmalate dehydratase small subunit
LPVFVCPTAASAIEDGHEVSLDINAGVITDVTTGEAFRAEPLPDAVRDIVAAGGLVPWVRTRLERAS